MIWLLLHLMSNFCFFLVDQWWRYILGPGINKRRQFKSTYGRWQLLSVNFMSRTSTKVNPKSDHLWFQSSTFFSCPNWVKHPLITGWFLNFMIRFLYINLSFYLASEVPVNSWWYISQVKCGIQVEFMFACSKEIFAKLSRWGSWFIRLITIADSD